MLKEIRKGLLAGFGAVLLTKEKVEEVGRKLVADAKLTPEDGQRLTDELVETGERQWAELEKSVTEAIRKGLDNLGLGSQEELQELKAKVDSMEKRLSIIEKSSQTPGK